MNHSKLPIWIFIPFIIMLAVPAFSSSLEAEDYQLILDQNNQSAMISSGHGHNCVVLEGSIECWGSNEFSEIDVPSTLQGTFQVSVGGTNTCALDLFYVTCWGSDGFHIIPVHQATHLSKNADHTCVIDAFGVFCFGGRNEFGELDVPSNLSNPRQIASGSEHSCVLDDDGVKCWGSNNYGELDVPNLSNPRQLVAGSGFSCAIDDLGLSCWGINNAGQLEIPYMIDPQSVSAGYDHICAIDQIGVQCWGKDAFGKTHVPVLLNPTQVSAGTHHSCAIDDGEIFCWGYNGWGQTEPGTKGNSSNIIADVESNQVSNNENTDENVGGAYSAQLPVAEAGTTLTPSLNTLASPTAAVERAEKTDPGPLANSPASTDSTELTYANQQSSTTTQPISAQLPSVQIPVAGGVVPLISSSSSS
jgi:alpha-tubulin suppressor-like RCC1 family protein